MEQLKLGQLTDLGLWSSASRIQNSRRLALLGDAGAIPPDVAAVAMELRRREIASFGEVIACLREYDTAINEYYNVNRGNNPPLAEGQSALDPIYRQYVVLAASPVIEQSWVWHNMPNELYMVNRLGELTEEEKQILQDLGYYAAGTNSWEGYAPYSADPAEIQSAKAYQELLGTDAQGKSLAVTIIWSVGSILLAGGIIGVVYRYFADLPARETAAVAEQANAFRNKQNMLRAEMDAQLFSYCMMKVQNGTGSAEECSRIRTHMGQYEMYTSPEEVAGSGCSLWSLWPLGLGGLLVGGLIGRKVSKKL